MLLDQIRRIRAAADKQIADRDAKIAELEAALNPDVQAELDAFEAELTPRVDPTV